MQRTFAYFAIGLLIFVVGWVMGGMLSRDRSPRIVSVVAAADAPRPKNTGRYEAIVFLKKEAGRYGVYCQIVKRDAHSNYQTNEELPRLALLDNEYQVYGTWDKVAFKPDGLHIGSYLHPTARLGP